MSTFLFDSIIFGPVWSRRLGESLGINLLPVNRKVCNFSCIYCECGLTPVGSGYSGFPPSGRVKELLEKKLEEMKGKGEYLDSITFAGNGEPTLHPEFPVILEDTLEIRDRIFPLASVTVLSNATRIGDKDIFNALLKADMNILKLDSAIEETLLHINCPTGNYNLRETVELLGSFNGKLIIQSLFFRGNYMGKKLDNTSEEEVSAWLSVLRKIQPESVMIYSLARDTAVDGLEGVSHEELNAIAGRVEKSGIHVQVTP
jgi:wyosine [tRNA(Phe)-imidazoG37] synthetase (radical SAM superfamily)